MTSLPGQRELCPRFFFVAGPKDLPARQAWSRHPYEFCEFLTSP